MATAGFYAVRTGRTPGIYRTWADASAQVTGFPGAQHKKFPTLTLAQSYLDGAAATPVRSPIKKKQLPYLQRPLPSPLINSPTESHIYCDGACSNNGGENPRAGVGVYVGPDDERNVSMRLDPTLYPRQTNQVAELMALIMAIRIAGTVSTPTVVIHSDSIYAINSVNVWRHAWIRKGWNVPNVNKTLHQELSAEYDRVSQRKTLLVRHVRGHSGIHGNEMADRLANQGLLQGDE